MNNFCAKIFLFEKGLDDNIGWVTGVLISSVQSGFLYSINKKWDFSFNGSIDGILLMATAGSENLFLHSVGFGLIYTPSRYILRKL